MKKQMKMKICKQPKHTVSNAREKRLYVKEILQFILISTLAVPAHAQYQQSVSNHILQENLLQSVRKVVIIDSIVAPKSDFAKYIPLPPECGKIEQQGESFQYTNEFGDRMIFSISDQTSSFIYSKIKEGGSWSQQKQEESLGEPSNYPFLMTDGVTLYYASKGNDCVGGYDIFATRYDSDNKRFLKSQNIGFPFNSEANDYLYIEDELDSLGWFVTDRRQPEGMVCIYTFIPPSVREIYSVENEGMETVKNRAAVNRIEDTWSGHYEDVRSAKQRLADIVEKLTNKAAKSDFSFVINDEIVYTSKDDFKVAGNKKLVEQLLEMKVKLNKSEEDLEKSRLQFHAASDFERNSMREGISKAEREVMQLRRDINGLTKRIRNEEIINLK